MLERELRVVTARDCIRVVGNVGDSPGPSDCHSELRESSDRPTREVLHRNWVRSR